MYIPFEMSKEEADQQFDRMFGSSEIVDLLADESEVILKSVSDHLLELEERRSLKPC
jgi:hypothetical protein